MINTFEYEKLKWIDVESPTKEEVKTLMETHGLDPEVADDLALPTAKQHVDFFDNYIYLVLFFPTLHAGKATSPDSWQEIDFIIKKNALITVRYKDADPLQNFRKVFEVNSILHKDEMGSHAGFLFFHVLSRLYLMLSNEIESIQDLLETIENKIFSEHEKEVVKDLSEINRQLLKFKQTIGAHEEILQTLTVGLVKMFGKEFTFYAEALNREYLKLYGEIRAKKEFLLELRETNDSLLSTKQNEAMRVFTMLALFTFPLSLIVGIFTLPTAYAPFRTGRYDFFIIIDILLIVFLTMLAVFKHKKWM